MRPDTELPPQEPRVPTGGQRIIQPINEDLVRTELQHAPGSQPNTTQPFLKHLETPQVPIAPQSAGAQPVPDAQLAVSRGFRRRWIVWIVLAWVTIALVSLLPAIIA